MPYSTGDIRRPLGPVLRALRGLNRNRDPPKRHRSDRQSQCLVHAESASSLSVTKVPYPTLDARSTLRRRFQTTWPKKPLTITPSEVPRAELARIGVTARGLPADLTWGQATTLAQSILREYTRNYAPQVAALIDAGDFNAAAAAFMANLHSPK